MKLGTENKKQTILAAVLMVVAVGLLVYQFGGHSEDTAGQPAATAGGMKPARKGKVLSARSLDPSLRFDLLRSSEDVTYKGNGRNIFSSQAPPPDIPTPIAKAIPDNVQQAPAPPPPSGLKFYGFAGPKNGNKKIFLIKGEDIFLAKEGDIVDRRYKVVRVGSNSVEIEDVLTSHTETLPLNAG
jgi:hypothetical protein